jgi:tellurite resistance protein TerC
MIARLAKITYKAARRIVIAIVGFTVLVLGIVMIVTPGPAFVAIPLGLAILSLEFAWARYWLSKVRRTISERTSRSQAQAAESHRPSRTGSGEEN